jgi:NAD(P)-dependent dehydrogenase (short-subunit alcohol dehydrogenase family)
VAGPVVPGSPARRIVVTGASRGIGRAVAEALLARGARVALVARDRRRLSELASAYPEQARVIEADLAEPAAAESAIERAAQALDGLDGLVGCAGIVRYGFVGGLTRSDLAEQLAVNFLAPVLASQRAAALMQAGGSIVHVASTLALHPAPGTLGYAASKAALLAAVKTLAAELAETGVRVNAVAPGVVDTEMIRVPRLRPGELPPEGSAREARITAELCALQELHPLGRLGTPADVRDAVLYLLDATWITGTVLVVDGGLLTR